jgi:hypothetical protein
MSENNVWEVRYTVPFIYNPGPNERVSRANREAMVIAHTAGQAITAVIDAERAHMATVENGEPDPEVEVIQVLRRNRYMRLIDARPALGDPETTP